MRADWLDGSNRNAREYDRLMESIEQLYQQGALAANDDTQAVFVKELRTW